MAGMKNIIQNFSMLSSVGFQIPINKFQDYTVDCWKKWSPKESLPKKMYSKQ